jgi:hypothetical protein
MMGEDTFGVAHTKGSTLNVIPYYVSFDIVPYSVAQQS